jgi:diguanylate cyclase (GGDEF)-like protein/PAS domain S-box-containing protein
MDDTVRESEYLFAAAFDVLTDGIIVLDGDHAVRHLNQAAQELLGWSNEAAYSRPWCDIIRPAGDACSGIPPTSDGAPTPGEYETSLLRRGVTPEQSGEPFTVRIASIDSPIRGNAITLRAGPSVAALQFALAESQRQLEITYDRGQVGFWEWDSRTNLLTESGYWVGKTLHTAGGAAVHDAVVLANTHPDDLARVQAALIAHLKGETDHYEVEQRFRLAAGGYIYFLVRGQAAECDASGRVLRMIGTMVDISALRKQGAVLSFALESSQQGIWEWDVTTDRMTEHGLWQPYLEDHELPASIDGRHRFESVHHDDRERMKNEIRHHLRGESEAIGIEVRMCCRDGTWGEFLVRGRALERDEHGRVSRVIGTYTEISGVKSQERHLQIALANGRQGLWDWEPEQDTLHFSREWYAMFGYPEGTITSLRGDMQAILHPDDVAPGRAAIVGMFHSESDNFEVEHRIRHIDGHYINILARGRILRRDDDNRIVRVIGTHVDISQLKHTQTELTESRRFLEILFNTIPERVFWKDMDSRYLGCSRLFALDVGLEDPAAIVGLSDDDLPWHTLADDIRLDDQRILTGADTHFTTERYVTAADGTLIWAETTKVPIRDQAGEIVGVLGTLSDITARLAREEQLQTVADAFTGTEDARLLDALTKAAAELSGSDHAFVARIDGRESSQARVTAWYPAESVMKELTYDLADTPCGDTSKNGRCLIAGQVAAAYPNDDMLRDGTLEGYAGQRLLSSDGETIGLLVLLFEREIADHERTENVLDVFAARAAKELEREQTYAVLRASEERLNTALEGSRQGVWEWYPESDEFDIVGVSFSNFDVHTGNEMFDLIHPDDRQQQYAAWRAHYRDQQTGYEFQGRFLHPDGHYHWALVRGQGASHDEHGRVTKMIGTITDISPLKQIQSELERSQQFLELVIDTVPQSIFWQDRDYRYLGANQQFADLASVESPDDLIGLTDKGLPWGDGAERFQREDKTLLDGDNDHLHIEMEINSANGEPGWFDLIKVPMRDSDGKVIGILGAIQDVSERRQAEKMAQRLAFFDPLTNLPNRRYFTERLEASLAAATRRHNKGALLFIDMDQFKQVNDTLGHSVGDLLLQAVSERLKNVTRQEDTVARLGGDEFVVLLPEIAQDFETCAHQAQLVADKIHQSLGQPFQFDRHQFHVTPTIGISLFPELGKDVDDVLKEADTAMYSGKAAGRNVTRFFRREMEEATQRRLRIEGDLRRAIVQQEFELYFQPQVDRSGDVTGAEVLLRWNHPERGQIPPAEFIPFAEERGLIVDIGTWVLNASFERFKTWLDRDIDINELAINVSSRQFRSDAFVDDVERQLVEYRIPPHRIVFEITESTVVEDVEATIEIMARLRRVGIRFAIDDFGVGYSSLSYLKRLPIDQLKIDRSFIADIGHDQNDEVICQTIVAMSQHLKLQTIAEGVETQAQYNFLSRLRCNGYQGYLFLPPSPEQQFLRYLAAS